VVTEADITEEPSPTNVTASSVSVSTRSYLGWDFGTTNQNTVFWRVDSDGGATLLHSEGRIIMFSETIIKTNIVAVRSISELNSDNIVVDIYERTGFFIDPKLIEARQVFSRIFEETSMAARIRHSTNWINKLDRECNVAERPPGRAFGANHSDYWMDERAGYGETTGGARIFLSPVQGDHAVMQFRDRIIATTRTPQNIPVDHSRVITAFQRALDPVFPSPANSMRRDIMQNFIGALNE
jgi:hypothetical protein